MDKMDNQTIMQDKAELNAAWDTLIAELQSARQAIDDPALFPPEASSRVLAEGYRYLAGFLHHGVERTFHEDADFPVFRNALSVINKSTIENPDAIYFYAPIDGRQQYEVTAQLDNFDHWQDKPRTTYQALAPQYLIFEVADGPMSGDTGELTELAKGFRTSFGRLDNADLIVSDEGKLKILLGPEKPAGYKGNFICTRKPPNQYSKDGLDRYATYISGRQLFYDWENEQSVALSIRSIDHIGQHPAPLTPAKTADHLRRMGAIIRGQMHFWLNFYDKVLNVHGSHGQPEDGRFFFPINGYNRPNAASGDTGGGMSTNVYAGGMYELADDEALYVEATYTGSPIYVSVHLGNLWGESPDYANHQSSLNLFQMYMGDDHVQRWIVSHHDPGIQNWLDTTGLPKGFLSHRWAYSEIPPESEWPVIEAKKIKLSDVDRYIPADMPRLSKAERAQAIAIRQAHVQRRYRSF
ncbi:MAG: hypothetical protein VX231_06280 [Pseudomonadota bacterium]|nr:hypothetical protein [Pseudomonadota bacterium]